MTPVRAADVCGDDARDLIDERFDVSWAGDDLSPDWLRDALPGTDVVVTSWGTPALDPDLLGAGHGGPGVVAHAAGTVKKLLDPATLAGEVTAFSAGTRIAMSVAEYCLTACLTLLRRLPAYDACTRAGAWKPSGFRGQELRGQRVGLVGGSSTARAFMKLLAPFDVEVLVYDPHLPADRARALGATSASLADVMRCPIVSIHVPDVPTTQGMITAELLADMPDGAIVINSARAAAIDHGALLAETARGRLRAALDVFDPEPARLSEREIDNPNLLLSPHIAGDSVEGHAALVGYVVRDVIDFLDHGTRGPSWVDPASWAISA